MLATVPVMPPKRSQNVPMAITFRKWLLRTPGYNVAESGEIMRRR